MSWSPEDWEVITDFPLLKQLGVYEVERMRTIALMAALFNMNNKKLGRDTMQEAKKANVVVDEQGGGRKDRSSNTGILCKTVTMDISRQLRLALANAGLCWSSRFPDS
jgi:hypothetical protein